MASWFAKVFGVAGRKEKAPKNQHSKIQAFPLRLLQQVTNNFDEKHVIGCGGFGKVYMAVLAGVTKVAMKRKTLKSSQGQKEFRMEIELMPGLNHRNLVSLIGYCEENNEMILVYEYMEKGTLTNHLYGSDEAPLDWKQRLEVCVGAAKGLHYLHTNSAKAIIHRDVKSANILLDERLRAKVGDFGISKIGPELDQTHVITEVKGSFGYLDPEYCRTLQLTEKSDVYSLGVVLLEVLCARPVIDPKLPREKVNLVEWGMGMLKKGKLKQIVDPKISGTIKPRSLKVFGAIMAKCLAEKSVERPSMEDVLMGLKYVRNLEVKNAFIGKICGRTSNVPDGLSDPSTSRVSPVLDESISVAENSDQSDHDVSSGNSDEDDHDVSAGNSDESYNDVNAENSDESDHDVSSQLNKLGGGKALTRSLGTVFSRDSDGPDDLSNPSVSQVSPVMDGNTMNGTVGLQDIVAHDGISVAGNSDESGQFSTSLQGAASPYDSDHGISSQLIQPGECKALTRSLAFRKDDP